jgi:hypothetical protein
VASGKDPDARCAWDCAAGCPATVLITTTSAVLGDGCAGREYGGRRERCVDRKDDRRATPKIDEHRAYAVGPLLQGWQRARVTGSDAPMPDWSKKISVFASTLC